MTILTAADIVGANAKVALGTAGQTARRIFITATGSANARFGDTNVGAARGAALPNGTPVQLTASDSDLTASFDLSQTFVYVPTGTTISYTWAV